MVVKIYGDVSAAADLNDTVTIAVQFDTPPAVALRLMHERGVPHTGASRRGTFEQEALLAHVEFRQQLRNQPAPFNISKVETISEHHRLFNGVFLRVPTDKVNQIARIPGVFAIFVDTGAAIAAYVVNKDAVDAHVSADFVHNKEARTLFNVEYINNALGYTGEGVRVAVLDTGVDYNHPCLVRYQDPATGRIRGLNFAGGDPNNIMDYHWHGTHVTGTIVAMAPDVQIYHYRVIGNDGRGTWGNVLKGLEEAHREGVDIINLSIRQGAVLSGALNLLSLDGILTIVGAGNDGTPDSFFSINPSAVAELPIFVANGTRGGAGATLDTINPRSSRGPSPELPYRDVVAFRITPDITAPGTNIYSTGLNGRFTSATGTSMATPAITGVAALMLSAFPNAQPYEIKARIMNNAVPLADIPEREDSVFTVGAGFIDPLPSLHSSSYVLVSSDVPIHNVSSTATVTIKEYLASFNFLSLGALVNKERTISASVHNMSGEVKTYTIEYVFTRNNNNSAGLALSHRTVIVPPGESRQFTATIYIIEALLARDCAVGFYEGHIYVRNSADNSIVARLPFALVNR
jgi:subtilisin family serine protease